MDQMKAPARKKFKGVRREKKAADRPVALAIVSRVSVPWDASVWQCGIPRKSLSARQLSVQRRLDVAASLAQFWVDERQAQRAIDVLLALGDHAAPLVQAPVRAASLIDRQGPEFVEMRRRSRTAT
jgi:hypothetical protein